MSHYYEDVDINPRNFRFPSPQTAMVNNLRNPQFNSIHQPWVLPGGSNYRPRFPPAHRHPNYTKPTDNVYNYAHPQPNNYRKFPNRFKYNRNYNHQSNRSDGGTQNLKMAFDRFLNNLHVNSHENSEYRSKPGSSQVKEQWQSKTNESSKSVIETKQESIKKSALAAKLKKSLENFQKDASNKKMNLSIINNTDISKTDASTRLPEIHPHFQWDLPLTVEDLRAIGRFPSGSAPDEPADDNDSLSSIEKQAYVQNTGSSSESPVEISPDIICIKHSRKRKSSESFGSEMKKRKPYMRRRHRSASPDLCMKSSSGNVVGDYELQQSSHVAQETLNNSLTTLPSDANQKSEDKEKPPQSSTVMQLLGIRRREFDELVNQPRSPRVHFMLGLLMKRHKELLMQRAMRSRISSKESHNQPGSSQAPDFPNSSVITSPDAHDQSNTLEGMGASDTIDQLSGILLDSSLEIDISSLPQELIDQLGTFLEMSTDMGSFNGGAGNLDQEDGRCDETLNSTESVTNAINDGGNHSETLPQDLPSDHRNITGVNKDTNVTENNCSSNIQIKKEVDTVDEGEMGGIICSENPIERLDPGIPGVERNVLEKSKNSNESAGKSSSMNLTVKGMAELCRGGVFGGNSYTVNRGCRAVDKNKASRFDRIFGENMSSSMVRNERVGFVGKESRNPVFCNTSAELNITREENSDVCDPSEDLVSISPERLAVSHPMNQSADLELESRNSSSSAVSQSCLSRTGAIQSEKESCDSLPLINSREESVGTNSLNESRNFFPAERPCASGIDSDGYNLDVDIIDSLWRIDLKILELMEEKKMLYEKLQRSRRERNDSLTNRNAFSSHLRVGCPSLVSPNHETPRAQTPRDRPHTSSSVPATSGNVVQDGSSVVTEKSPNFISTETTSLVHKAPENVYPSTSGNESGKTIPHFPEISTISFSNASEYFTPTTPEKELDGSVNSTPIIHTNSASFTTPRYMVEDTSCKVKNTPKRLKKHEYVSLVANVCNMPENEVSSLISVQPPPLACSSPSKVLQRLTCKDDKYSKGDELSHRDGGRARQSSEGKCGEDSARSENVPSDKNQKDNLSPKSSASHCGTVISVPTDQSSESAIGRPLDDSIEILYDAKIKEDSSNLRKGEFKGHKESVLAIKICGKFLFASCSDKCVYCYDLNTREVIRKFQGHTDTVTCIYAKLVGKKKFELYSGSHDKRLLVYISEVSQFTHSRTASEPIQCMEEGWGSLYLGTKGGMIERFKIGRGDFMKPPLLKSKNEIMAIQTSVEGPRKVLIVASRNMPIVVRDAHTGLLLRSINEEQAKNTTYCIFVHHGVVYSGVKNLGITACDYTNGQVLRTYKGCGIIVAVKVSDSKVYAASYDGKIYIYDIKSQRLHCQIKASDKMLLCMEQIDNTIYAGSIDGKLTFWRIP